MSWVREAIDDIKVKSYEELYPTPYGGSSSARRKPSHPVTPPTPWLWPRFCPMTQTDLLGALSQRRTTVGEGGGGISCASADPGELAHMRRHQVRHRL